MSVWKKNSSQAFYRLISFIAAASTYSACQAAELGDFYNLPKPAAATTIRLGLVAISGAKYQGSDEQRVLVVPAMTLQNPNGLFLDPINGLGFNFQPAGDFQYGVRATFETGRSTESTLPGFEKIKARLNPGAFANYKVTDRWTLKSAVRLAVGEDGKGSVLNVGTSYRVYQSGPFFVDVNASAKYADSRYQQTYFGVNAGQAAASGFKAFQPKAGVNTLQLGVTTGFPISQNIYAFSGLGLQKLVGDAADSPITQRKQRMTAFIGGAYSF